MDGLGNVAVLQFDVDQAALDQPIGESDLDMHVYSDCENRASALGTIALLAVIVAIAANALIDGFGILPAWLVSAPTVAGAFGLLYKAADKIGWRWSLLRRIGLIETPVVEGTYEGHLVSSHQNTSVPVRIRIDQTWTRISVRFEVIEPASSTSYSVSAELRRVGHDDARLTYTYRNQPQPGVAEDDMKGHDGTAEVTIGHATGRVSGRYYNFRGRQGTLTLARH